MCAFCSDSLSCFGDAWKCDWIVCIMWYGADSIFATLAERFYQRCPEKPRKNTSLTIRRKAHSFRVCLSHPPFVCNTLVRRIFVGSRRIKKAKSRAIVNNSTGSGKKSRKEILNNYDIFFVFCLTHSKCFLFLFFAFWCFCFCFLCDFSSILKEVGSCTL